MTIINSTSITLGVRLKTARISAGLEQADIAQKLGVNRGTVSNWERGVSEPGATPFVRWAEITGQPLEWLAAGVVVHPPGLEPGTH